MKHLLPSLIVVVALGDLTGARAQSNEIALVAPGGIRAAVEQLIPGFERKTGRKVKPTFSSTQGTRTQVAQRGAFDVAIVQPPYPEVLASGNVIASSEATIAVVPVGIAVRKGAPKPDISTPEALKKTLLAAKSIAYPNPSSGAEAGISFEATIKKVGIDKQIEGKLIRAGGKGGSMTMVAKGEAEIGVTFISEMDDPGIDAAGPLPRAVSEPTTMVGFISTHAKDPAAAKALLDYLSSPDAAAVYKSLKMQPGR